MLLKSQVKYIQSLRDKKFRDLDRVFVAEGPKIVGEFLDAGHPVPQSIFATTDWISAQGKRLAAVKAAELFTVSDAELGRLSSLSTPNQVLGIFLQPEPKIFQPGRLSLALDNIQDPGNLGTIIRIADWFAVDQIICSESGADAFNSKVIQASMGSICRVGVSYRNLEEFFQQPECPEVYAAVLDGINLFDATPVREAVILIGNESKGISTELLALADHRISIPRRGKAESLNAAIAAGIILAQFTR